MTFEQFHNAVKTIAAGRHFAAKVETCEYDGGVVKIAFGGYIDRLGWVDGATAESVLSRLAAPRCMADVRELGDVPAASDGIPTGMSPETAERLGLASPPIPAPSDREPLSTDGAF